MQRKDFDLIITGRESIDYNVGIVLLLATHLDIPFVNAYIGLELEGKAKVVREIDGGKETLDGNLPMLIAGQKALLKKRSRIPAMRGIMMARKKPLV